MTVTTIYRATLPDRSNRATDRVTISLRNRYGAWQELLRPTRGLEAALSAAAGGDRDAFEEIYDATSPMVYGLALRILRSPAIAEEVSQEVYLQIWRQADRFDPHRGSARAWIMTLTHRRAVDAVRRNQSAADRESRVKSDPPPADTADLAVDRMEHTLVRSALDSLTNLQRQAIELAFYGGLTHHQVAEALDTPVGTVKTRMRDGLLKLRSTMRAIDV